MPRKELSFYIPTTKGETIKNPIKNKRTQQLKPAKFIILHGYYNIDINFNNIYNIYIYTHIYKSNKLSKVPE